MNKNINNLTINEISFFNKIFGENKATDIIQNQESELFLFYNGLSETFNHKDRDNHFILLSISKLIDNDNYNKLNEVFDEEYNYSIKNVSFLMNKKSLCSTDGIPTLKLDDSCIIRDNLIIVGKRTTDNEDSKTKEFLNNIQWAFDKIKEIMNKDKENIISNSLFPKTDLFFHLIGDEDFSIPIQRVKFLMRGKNKIVVNDNLLIPIMFKTKGTTKKAG